jgi:ATP-dependent DNA helicase RecG
MALPINIEELIHGNTVEWERLEFKKGWNPEEIIHTICAFANDLNNWGGGYVILGIEEQDGQPVLPPVGIHPGQLDKIQGEVLELANQMQPHYFPRMQPYILSGQHIIVLWCPAGDHRPYTAPSTQGKGAQRQPYVRYGSRSIVARDENLHRLNELTARIPFDDRINHKATIQDFDLGLIQAFLQEVKSDLYEESKHISLAALTRNMYIAKGSDEDLRPVNAGLLFFSTTPEKYFPRTWIELVWHQDDSSSNFTEHYFRGALHVQLRAALAFLRANVIGEHVQKVSYQAEAIRFHNFPYAAVEESLSNAVYHKSYELGKPIEIQVWPDKIEILSYPGAIPPVGAQIMKRQERIVARDYRNRRIGDFLKELELTEGRATGFPTIYKAMEQNGSPTPIFDTDDESTYFLVTLPAHDNALTLPAEQKSNQGKQLIFNSLNELTAWSNQESVQQNVQESAQQRAQVEQILQTGIGRNAERIMTLLQNKPLSKNELLAAIGLSNHIANKQRHIDPLLATGWISYTVPENPNDRNQKYEITPSGKRLLQLISHQ